MGVSLHRDLKKPIGIFSHHNSKVMLAIILSAIFVGLFFGGLATSIISEWKYQQKRKKVVEGAIFGYYNGNNAVEVEVIEDRYLYFTVRYRVVGEDLIREMAIRDFVTVYVK